MQLLLIDKHKSAVIPCSAEFAARFMDLTLADIEWSIEEYGRCDTARYVAIPRNPGGEEQDGIHR